jgi:hypothetical protein
MLANNNNIKLLNDQWFAYIYSIECSYWKKNSPSTVKWHSLLPVQINSPCCKTKIFSSYLRYETHRWSLIKLLKYFKCPIGDSKCAHWLPIVRGVPEVCLWCSGIAVHFVKTCCSLHKRICTETHLPFHGWRSANILR